MASQAIDKTIVSTSIVVDIGGIVIKGDVDEGREAAVRAGAGGIGGTSVIDIRTSSWTAGIDKSRWHT